MGSFPTVLPFKKKFPQMQPKGGFRPLSAEPFYGAGDDGEADHTWKFDDANFNLTPHSYTYVWGHTRDSVGFRPSRAPTSGEIRTH